MKRLLREPLLHFLLLGAATVRPTASWPSAAGSEPGEIVVTQGQSSRWRSASLAPGSGRPRREELEGLIRDHVREEVYYREAMALGLDQDDTIIRRRLRQKMEFLTEDVAAQAEPTDDELSAYLKAHPDAFRVERRFTFSQVYLNPDSHGEHLARDAAQLLAQLNQAGGEADVSALGDPFLLEPHVRRRCRPARSRSSSAKRSRRSWASFRPANGRGRSSPATACIWCSSASARKDACPRWRKCGTPCAASGPTPGGWKPTRSSIKDCSSATR